MYLHKDSYVKLTVYPKLIRFLYSARASVSMDKVKKFVESAKKADPKLPIFIVGLCWGGKYSLMTATDRLEDGLVKAVAALHPSLLSLPRDLKGLGKVPVWLGVGTADDTVSTKVVNKLNNCFKESGVEYESVWFQDMPHGYFSI